MFLRFSYQSCSDKLSESVGLINHAARLIAILTKERRCKRFKWCLPLAQLRIVDADGLHPRLLLRDRAKSSPRLGDASVSGNLFLDYSRGSDPSLFAYSHLAFAGHVILIRMFLRLSDVEVVNIDVD